MLQHRTLIDNGRYAGRMSLRLAVALLVILSFLNQPLTALAAGPAPERTAGQPLPQAQEPLWADVAVEQSTLSQGEAQSVTVTDGALQLEGTALSGEYLSPAIASPLPFTSVSPKWNVIARGNVTYQFEIRTSLDGGTWSSWVDELEDSDVNPVNGKILGALTIVTDMNQPERFFQFRVHLNRATEQDQIVLKTISVFVIDASQGFTTEQAIANQKQLDAAAPAPSALLVDKPPVISRAAWGCSDGNGSRWRPRYSDVYHIIVHHTAGNNSASNWAAVVRSIWTQHTISNDWGDIGYNYLIDPNGVIYEGRAGGDNVIAAHALNFNTGTMGVSVIGTYTSQMPTQAAINSLETLIAWKVQQRGLDPKASTNQNGRTYPVIAGHRDVGSTSCPGNRQYEYLPRLRDNVVNRSNPERDNVVVSYGTADGNRIDSANDEDTYYFDGSAGQKVEVTMTATEANLDPLVVLYRPDGSLVGEDDDSAGSRNALLVADLNVTGRYRVVARMWNHCCVGNYNFKVSLIGTGDGDDNRWISGGQTLNGTISLNNDSDLYYFNSTAGRNVSIRMNKNGSNLDSYLELWGPNGAQLATNDDGGGSYNSWIIYTLPTSGAYRIVARSYNQGSSGAYTISLGMNSGENLALNRPVRTSSQEVSWLPGSQAVDGNIGTRWSSQFSDPSWIYVDLGQDKTINQVVLKWETAYGRAYTIYVQPNSQSGTNNWTSVFSTTSGDGSTDTITFNPVTARYVLMWGSQRGTGWGYSLWEFEVYNSAMALIPLVPPDDSEKPVDLIAPLMPLAPTEGDKPVELIGNGDTGQENMPALASPPAGMLMLSGGAPAAPVAEIKTVSKLAVNPGEVITLTGAGSDANGETITAYRWYSDYAGSISETDQGDAMPIIGDRASVQVDTAGWPSGVTTLYLQVENSVGEVSNLASVTILVKYQVFVPVLKR